MAPDKQDGIPFTFEVDAQEFVLTLRSDETGGLTPREWGFLKRHAAIGGAVAFQRALEDVDVEMYCVLAWIATRRAGASVDIAAMLDGKVEWRLVPDETEAGTVPPTAASPSGAA